MLTCCKSKKKFVFVRYNDRTFSCSIQTRPVSAKGVERRDAEGIIILFGVPYVVCSGRLASRSLIRAINTNRVILLVSDFVAGGNTLVVLKNVFIFLLEAM